MMSKVENVAECDATEVDQRTNVELIIIIQKIKRVKILEIFYQN